MPAKRYRFHCTDGHQAVFDLGGHLIGPEILIRRYAERVARGMMDSYGRGLDWSDWIVDVHDADGKRVITLEFSDLQEVPRVAA